MRPPAELVKRDTEPGRWVFTRVVDGTETALWVAVVVGDAHPHWGVGPLHVEVTYRPDVRVAIDLAVGAPRGCCEDLARWVVGDQNPTPHALLDRTTLHVDDALVVVHPTLEGLQGDMRFAPAPVDLIDDDDLLHFVAVHETTVELRCSEAEVGELVPLLVFRQTVDSLERLARP